MSAAARLREIEVFSRPGCHLCEQLVEELLPMVRDRFDVVVRNIDLDAEWSRQYSLKIPVVVLDGVEICHFHLDRDALSAATNVESGINPDP